MSFHIFKVSKTIVNVCICNGQLKICRPFIFDRTVLHLVTSFLYVVAFTFVHLTAEFPGIKCRAGLVGKRTKFSADTDSNVIPETESAIGVHTELSQTIPVCAGEQQTKNRGIVQFVK